MSYAGYRVLKRDITIEEDTFPINYASVGYRYVASLDGNLHPRGPRVNLVREGDTLQEAMEKLEEAIKGFGWRLAEA